MCVHRSSMNALSRSQILSEFIVAGRFFTFIPSFSPPFSLQMPFGIGRRLEVASRPADTLPFFIVAPFPHPSTSRPIRVLAGLGQGESLLGWLPIAVFLFLASHRPFSVNSNILRSHLGPHAHLSRFPGQFAFSQSPLAVSICVCVSFPLVAMAFIYACLGAA